ncbi:S-adenosyl-L-methionine-dependent methyltransferase [Thamnocephalis sphaerospora]|uniref:S-adenosyl-L-methionine-dependent methyltransferase n=1 Tax=Thamnocephalis sphaerospora TaxID=78915 RepID=A0A4P9XJD3_9FUNG|nr:S-adenosyl-L-methionine-dependent methyltransferase [Thamnocephalis sphaerospora]|eukprot:RKP05836.1 S-adenosyl-L-methionine-dependent methyltransferase [Thamnocephalis sphaerospora]
MDAPNNSSSSGDDSKAAEVFLFADGRRYHNTPNCPYVLPNDLEEIDRLEVQYYAIQQVTQKRYHVPLNNPKRIIDIGIGTGVWMRETALDFPECEFTGIDITPLPETTVMPANCNFKLANVLEGLAYADGHFDFVRHSLLIAGIPKDKWPFYVKECMRLCASGGWVEMTETNAKIHGGGAATKKLSAFAPECFRARGLSPEIADTLDDLMREAGLVDVEAREFKVPLGKRGGKAGELLLRNFLMGQAMLTPLYVSVYGITREEAEQTIQQAADEFEVQDAYAVFRVCFGRKP